MNYPLEVIMESIYQDRESLLYSNLFQQAILDLKNGAPLWEDFVTKAARLHSTLRTTLQAVGVYLEAFQKIADAATSSTGSLREIGSALTIICLRQRALEARVRSFTNSIIECLVQPLQDKIEEWKRTTNTLDKEYIKEAKKAKAELKKLGSKKTRKGLSSAGSSTSLSQGITGNDYSEYQVPVKINDFENRAVQAALNEGRTRFYLFVQLLKPVLDQEISLMWELGHVKEAVEQLDKASVLAANTMKKEEITEIQSSSKIDISSFTPPTTRKTITFKDQVDCWPNVQESLQFERAASAILADHKRDIPFPDPPPPYSPPLDTNHVNQIHRINGEGEKQDSASESSVETSSGYGGSQTMQNNHEENPPADATYAHIGQIYGRGGGRRTSSSMPPPPPVRRTSSITTVNKCDVDYQRQVGNKDSTYGFATSTPYYVGQLASSRKIEQQPEPSPPLVKPTPTVATNTEIYRSNLPDLPPRNIILPELPPRNPQPDLPPRNPQQPELPPRNQFDGYNKNQNELYMNKLPQQEQYRSSIDQYRTLPPASEAQRNQETRAQDQYRTMPVEQQQQLRSAIEQQYRSSPVQQIEQYRAQSSLSEQNRDLLIYQTNYNVKMTETSRYLSENITLSPGLQRKTFTIDTSKGSVADTVRNLTERHHQPASPLLNKRTTYQPEELSPPPQQQPQQSRIYQDPRKQQPLQQQNMYSPSPVRKMGPPVPDKQWTGYRKTDYVDPAALNKAGYWHQENTPPSNLQIQDCKMSITNTHQEQVMLLQHQQQQHASHMPKVSKAFRVRQFIARRTVRDPTICHDSLMDQIRRGAILKKTDR